MQLGRILQAAMERVRASVREGDSHIPRRWPVKFTFADVLTAAAQGQPAERQLPRERETSHGVGAAESRVGPHPQVAKLDLSRFSARHGSPMGKRVAGCDPCPRGINPEDIFPKVSRASAADWIWVRKGTALSPHLGFPTTRAEVRRFGGSARRIWRVPERRRDHRSFAEVVMERRPPPQRADWLANKRRATEQGSGAWGNRATRDEEELRRHLLAQKGNQGVVMGGNPIKRVLPKLVIEAAPREIMVGIVEWRGKNSPSRSGASNAARKVIIKQIAPIHRSATNVILQVILLPIVP